MEPKVVLLLFLSAALGLFFGLRTNPSKATDPFQRRLLAQIRASLLLGGIGALFAIAFNLVFPPK